MIEAGVVESYKMAHKRVDFSLFRRRFKRKYGPLSKMFSARKHKLPRRHGHSFVNGVRLVLTINEMVPIAFAPLVREALLIENESDLFIYQALGQHHRP